MQVLGAYCFQVNYYSMLVLSQKRGSPVPMRVLHTVIVLERSL